MIAQMEREVAESESARTGPVVCGDGGDSSSRAEDNIGALPAGADVAISSADGLDAAKSSQYLEEMERDRAMWEAKTVGLLGVSLVGTSSSSAAKPSSTDASSTGGAAEEDSPIDVPPEELIEVCSVEPPPATVPEMIDMSR